MLADAKRPYSVRLSAIGTVRFLQATRGDECKAEVLKCCAALLPHGDLADQAIEDLRRWGYWDLTTDVLAQFASRRTPRRSSAARSSAMLSAAPGDEAEAVRRGREADRPQARPQRGRMLELYARA